MPDNICSDRFDPIDREANTINHFMMKGDSASATARLQDDLARMGPTQFMALVGETKALANASNALTHLEITPLVVPGDPCPAPARVDVSLVTQVNGPYDPPAFVRNEVARIDNRESYQTPQPIEQGGPIRDQPAPPPVIIVPNPGRIEIPREDPSIKVRIDLGLGIGGHSSDRGEPYCPPRQHDYHPGGDRRTDAPVIVNNNNTVIVKNDNASSSDSHQKNDNHKRK